MKCLYLFYPNKMGYLEKGWEYFESGFDSKIPLNKGRQPNRRFKVPLWLGEEGSQKSLLVWAEQGIGDEILFMSLLKDLSTKDLVAQRMDKYSKMGEFKE